VNGKAGGALQRGWNALRDDDTWWHRGGPIGEGELDGQPFAPAWMEMGRFDRVNQLNSGGVKTYEVKVEGEGTGRRLIHFRF
jgi:hypothetical protein